MRVPDNYSGALYDYSRPGLNDDPSTRCLPSYTTAHTTALYQSESYQKNDDQAKTICEFNESAERSPRGQSETNNVVFSADQNVGT